MGGGKGGKEIKFPAGPPFQRAGGEEGGILFSRGKVGVLSSFRSSEGKGKKTGKFYGESPALKSARANTILAGPLFLQPLIKFLRTRGGLVLFSKRQRERETFDSATKALRF